jgi:hypothetical protein
MHSGAAPKVNMRPATKIQIRPLGVETGQHRIPGTGPFCPSSPQNYREIKEAAN